MDSQLNGSGKDSPTRTPKSSRFADEQPTCASAGAAAEVLRLQNLLKFKEKELNEARKEIATGKVALHNTDKALHQANEELMILKERHAATEGELSNMAKELAAIKVQKRKLEVQLGHLARKGDKEQSTSMLMAQRSSLVSVAAVEGLEHVASLQADLRTARQEGERAAESIRVLENVIRNKDRMIHSLQRKVEDVELYKTKCGDLENRVSDLLRQLENEKSAYRTNSDVLRLSDAEKAKLCGELFKVRTALQAAQESAARSSAGLKASEARCSALESEVGVLAGQLARASAVAQRVAAAEVRAGCKDEGVVHVTRHLEEVRFMSGEIVRLQQRVSALEKELAVSEELKGRYRRMSQPGNSAQSSPLSSPAGGPLNGRSAIRPGSARVAAASRPKSAPPNGGIVRLAPPPPTVATTRDTIGTAKGDRTPRSGVRAGAAAAAGGDIRASFSKTRQQQTQLPKEMIPKSPGKAGVAAAAANLSTSHGAAAGRAAGKRSTNSRPASAVKVGGAVKDSSRRESVKSKVVEAAAEALNGSDAAEALNVGGAAEALDVGDATAALDGGNTTAALDGGNATAAIEERDDA